MNYDAYLEEVYQDFYDTNDFYEEADEEQEYLDYLCTLSFNELSVLYSLEI